MKVKEKNINIVIENNIFSKNKNKPEDKKDDKRTSSQKNINPITPLVQQRSLYESEPSYLSQLKAEISKKDYYNMRINPQPQMNNYYNPPITNNPTETTEPIEPIMPIDMNLLMDQVDLMDNTDIPIAQLIPSSSIIPIFNKDGKYVGPEPKRIKNEAKRSEILEKLNNGESITTYYKKRFAL
jgi:hypothetical protein